MLHFNDYVKENKDNKDLYENVISELSRNYLKTPIMFNGERISLGYEDDNESLDIKIVLKEMSDKVMIMFDEITADIYENDTKNVKYNLHVGTYDKIKKTVNNNPSDIAKEIHSILKNDLGWVLDNIEKMSINISKSVKNMKASVQLK